MRANEIIACTECGGQTIAARPVCRLCEADKVMFAPRVEPVPADPEFARWWMTPDASTGHAPSASLDLGSAKMAWTAARTIPSAAAPPATCPMRAFLDKLESSDPAVRAGAEAHAERAADEMSGNWLASTPPAPARVPIRVPGGQFEAVGNVWHERVNDEYNATLNHELVSEGETLFRFVAHPGCDICKSEGFPPSVTGTGCTFCDGTEGGVGPAVQWQPGEDGLDADDITNLREALSWMGESTYESHEECGIHRYRLIRRLIAANLFARDYAYAQSAAGHAPAGPLKDHDVREAVNQLRAVAVQFHHTQQLRSRIQDIVLPLMARAITTRNN